MSPVVLTFGNRTFVPKADADVVVMFIIPCVGIRHENAIRLSSVNSESVVLGILYKGFLASVVAVEVARATLPTVDYCCPIVILADQLFQKATCKVRRI